MLRTVRAHALEIRGSGRGTHFDPHLLDAFVAVGQRFAETAAKFSGAEV